MIESAKKLVEMYKNISIKDIRKSNKSEIFYANNIMYELTGFGSTSKCILCQNANHKCENCIHKYANDENETFKCVDDTYELILNSENEEQLLDAIKKRIEHLEKLITIANSLNK